MLSIDGGIDDEQPIDLGEYVDPAGEGSLPPHMGADQMFGEPVRGFVLADVARLKARGDHALDARGGQRGLSLASIT